ISFFTDRLRSFGCQMTVCAGILLNTLGALAKRNAPNRRYYGALGPAPNAPCFLKLFCPVIYSFIAEFPIGQVCFP
ncbi:MAG: hypothetical protein V2I97_00630, partial [Desulfococcaceae bacterium]|nr:hypothetical protein [Desulfococcaceae bacterium]